MAPSSVPFPYRRASTLDKIEASFAKGVLTIKLPKTAEAQAEKKFPSRPLDG